MTHSQKVSFNDVLTAHVENVQARHPELTSFNAAVRYLVVMGLAAEFDREAALGRVTMNPFLHPAKELMEP